METYYASTVMVFDIELNSNLVETIDNIIINVKPIFQYNYIYLSADRDSFQYQQNYVDYSIDYNLSSDIVIAAPSYANRLNTNNNFVVEYEMVDRYYLKDISMGVALFNEQELNYGDIGYNPYNDIGSYITSYNYIFDGKKRVNGSMIDLTEEYIDGVFSNVDTALWILGWLEVLPEVDIISDLASVLLSMPSLIYSWYDDLDSGVPTQYVSTTPSFTEDGIGKIEVQAFYQNRDDQLAHYTDDDGQPALVKAATIPFNAALDGGVWYGVNDFASGYFKVNHSALNQQANHTRFVKDVTLKVMDSSDGSCVMFGTNTTHEMLREPVYKSVELEQSANVNLLPNGTNYFTFNASYASNYMFQIPNANSMVVKVDGSVVNFSNNQANILLGVGEHDIEIKSNNQTGKMFSTLTISPDVMDSTTSSKSINVNGGGNYLLKVTNLSQVKQLNSNNNNVTISGIYVDSSCATNYVAKGVINSATKITHPFVSGDYYVLLSNSSTTAQSINFTISEPITLNVDVELAVEMNANNYEFVKFTSTEMANYVITATNTTNLQYVVYKNDVNLTNAGGTYYSGSFYDIGFDANQTYYIGIKNGTNSTNNLTIKKSENAYYWQIVGGDVNQNTNEENISLKRNVTYNIELYINGKPATNVVYGYDNQSTNFGNYSIVTSGKSITLNANTAVGGNGIIVKCRNSNLTDGYIIKEIKIIPTINETITVGQLINAQDIKFTYTASNYIFKFEYQLLPYTNTFTYEIGTNNAVQNTSNSASISILNNIMTLNNSTPQNLELVVTKYYYLDAFNSQNAVSTEIKLTTKINNLFAGGTGTQSDPCLISYIRHLNNATSKNYYFKLTTSIALGTLSPFAEMKGTLDGNGYTISYNLTTSVDSGNFGLYVINNGTIKNLVVNAEMLIEEETGGWINAGLICAINSGTIQGCTTYGSLSNYRDNSRTGGLVGYNYATISGCRNNAIIIGSGDIGGIAGLNDGGAADIYNCVNNANIYYYFYTTSRSIGGIVGYQAQGNISACTNYGTIMYGSPTSDSRELNPAMSQILGNRQLGYVGSNSCLGSVNIGTLHTETWKTGIWPFQTKHEHNQAQYVSTTGEIGYDSGR